MYLTRLALTDFRSYQAADLVLEPGVSTLLGGNGQGKTNLVEAVGYVATLASHRVATDSPLVRHGAERAILRVAVTGADRDSLIELEINPGRANRARLNRVPVPRPRQVLGTLRTVLFAPEDLALVKGDPEQRRRYLDDLLVARAPRLAAVRSDYERVLRQRTALLKSLRGRAGGSRGVVPPGHARAGGSGGVVPPGQQGKSGARRVPARAGGSGSEPPDEQQDAPRGPASTLEVWDEHLATTGAELVAARIELAAALRPLVSGAYAAVSGEPGDVSLAYRQSRRAAGRAGAGPGSEDKQAADTDAADEPAADRAALADGLRAAIAAARADELERGVCLVGPHRDELELGVGGLPARGYASQGESWSMALALRLSGFELLRAAGDDPVLLLDDVFAELDTGRRERLASLVAGAEQVLVTAAVPADVPDALKGARFEVADGAVTRAS
ncbi:MAG TPA: DNA replication/repair protein RecF [Streptosporangiaceae bacterium]|nr:DNA replication/repair protein RecF [Streptosporangiaceae bacterium]